MRPTAWKPGKSRNLGLQPIVSLTDHDDIESGLALRRTPLAPAAPVSFEWTVPFGPTFFHLGVHNLPTAQARAMFADLREYTRRARNPRGSGELLEVLHAREDLLVVLNHPLWDEADIGMRAPIARRWTPCFPAMADGFTPSS
jgi:hypothetical protein